VRVVLKKVPLACLLLWFSTALAAEDRQTILIEAEGFDRLGGWLIDQQHMDQMGSPVLLAHGLGQAVEDAVTTVAIPTAAEYRVWVRTRDWAATFRAPGTPGRFQLLVGGEPLETTFGTEGAEWHWQDGGTVKLPAGKVALALHDLTGFDGRCDAIVLTIAADFAPPNDDPEMAEWRRKLLDLPETPKDTGQFDLVVVGGGMAGCCAAVSAARLGLDVALIQNRPVLGGNNSSEVRVSLGGRIHLPPYPAIGGVVRELAPPHGGNAGPPEQFGDEKKQVIVEAEPTLRLFLNTHIFDAEMDDNRIVAVLGRDICTNEVLRFTAKWFADCTGDANLGVLAGADHRYGRESRAETGESLAVEEADRQTMGTSVMWRTRQTEQPTTFPEAPWAIQFNEKNYQRATRGDWNWETGFRWDQIEDFEKVRDHGLRAVFGNWSFQKNHAPDKEQYANLELDWVACIGGKRESRRLLGDLILKQQDVDEAKPYPDACVTATWSIDLHYPSHSDQFPGEEFRSYAEFHRGKPYPIPYRCFYSRNIENLFMAGRNISVTHVALGTVRVMRTCGMMGEVVGMAAAVCKTHDGDPRDVYAKYVDELKELMTKGVGSLPVPFPPRPPEWIDTAGPNLARSAKAASTSAYKKANYPVTNVNDGRVSYTDNRLRYVSDEESPTHVELAWQSPQTISATRIVTGQSGGPWPHTPIIDFVIQYHDGDGYRDIPQTKITGNESPDWHTRFEPVTTTKLRLTVTKTPGDLTRIWEWEVYDPPTERKP